MKVTILYQIGDSGPTYGLHGIESVELELRGYPHSLYYFCSECGDIWATAKVVLENGENPYHEVLNVPCRMHKERGVRGREEIPGALCSIASINPITTSVLDTCRSLDSLPPKLLEREFNVTLDYYERIANDS